VWGYDGETKNRELTRYNQQGSWKKKGPWKRKKKRNKRLNDGPEIQERSLKFAQRAKEERGKNNTGGHRGGGEKAWKQLCLSPLFHIVIAQEEVGRRKGPSGHHQQELETKNGDAREKGKSGSLSSP